MSAKRVFVDTNILVYAKLQTPETLDKHQCAVQFLGGLSDLVIVSLSAISITKSLLCT